jgi:hypothetical protein
MAEKTPEQLLAASEERAKLLKIDLEVAETRKEQLEIEEKIANVLHEQAELQLEIGKGSSESLEKYKEYLVTAKRAKKAREEELDILEKIKAAIEEQKSAQEEVLDIVGSIGAKYENTILDKIAKSQVSIEQLGVAFKKNFSIDRLSGAVFDAFTESIGAAVIVSMTAATELARATGAGNSFRGMINDTTEASSAMGVGIAEQAAAVGALHANMSGFTSMGKDTQNALMGVTAELEAAGISSDVTASQMEYTTRVMGLSANEAKAQAEGMRTFAMNAGIAPAKMAQEFAAAGPRIAQYGSEAGKVFEGLTLQSKKLGIEMNDLLSITQQFDTFEGAADAAGKLNAVLGGPFLNSMELLTAETEEQRVTMLQNSLQMSGKSFDSMDRFERKALASAAGISDMSVAAKLFGSASQQMSAEHKMLGLTAEEVAERQKAGVSVMKKLEVAVQNLAPAVEPIVNILTKMTNAVAHATKEYGGLLKFLGLVGASLYVLRKSMLLYRAIMVSTAAIEGVGIIRRGLMAVKNFFLATSNTAVATTAAPAAAGTAALGTASTAAAPGVGALALALLGIGLSVLMIGAGIGLAVAGVALLVYSFASLLKVVIENVAVMPKVAVAIIDLGLAFMVLGPGLAIAGAGFIVFAASMAIGIAILALMIPQSLLAASAINTISVAVAGLGLAFMFVGSGISSISESIGSVVEGMRELSGENGVAKFVTVVDSIDDSNIDNLGKLMDEAERLVVVNAQLSALEATQAVGSAINKLISFIAPDSNASSEASKREVVLQINDREFARAVVEALDDDMKLSLA